MSIVYYLCDGEKEDCKKNNCYKKVISSEENSLVCKHTKDVCHAKNFQKRVPIEQGGFWENELKRNSDD